MTDVRSDAPRLTISLNLVDDMRLEKRASFKTSEDRVAFLDAIKNAREQVAKGVLNPTLEIPQPVNAQSLGLVASKFDSSAVLIGSTLLDVMTILHEIGQQMRQTAKDSRAVSRDAEVDKLREAADQIRKGAIFALASGITSGAMTIGGGLMSGIGAAKGANTAMKGIQAADAAKPDMSQMLKNLQSGQQPGTSSTSSVGSGDVQLGRPRANAMSQSSGSQLPGSSAPTATDTRTGQVQKQGLLSKLHDKLLDSKSTEVAIQSKSIDASSTLGNMQMQRWQATGQMLSGAGQIVGAALDSISKFMDAYRAELEADAKMYGYQSQEQDEIVQKMLELMRDVRQKLGEIEQAQSQVQSKIWS